MDSDATRKRRAEMEQEIRDCRVYLDLANGFNPTRRRELVIPKHISYEEHTAGIWLQIIGSQNEATVLLTKENLETVRKLSRTLRKIEMILAAPPQREEG